MVEYFERLSRAQMLNGLRAAGFTGKPAPFTIKLKVPEATEALLAQMTFTAQFQAVRELHALMRTQGESPPVLAALARGYAHLGVLTEFHWDSAPKVFKARALL